MVQNNYARFIDSWMMQANDPYNLFYAFKKKEIPPRKAENAESFMIWDGIEVEINGFSVKKGTVVGGSKIEPVFYTPRDFIAQYEFLEVNPVSFRPVRDGSMYRKCLDSMQQKIKELNKNYQ